MEISPPFFFFQVFLLPKTQTKDKAASVLSSREHQEAHSQQVHRQWMEILSKARQLFGFYVFFFIDCDFSTLLKSRVQKNKSMQHHTMGVGTAEFKVAWFPKAHVRSKMYEPTQLKRPSRRMKNKSLCSKWCTPPQAGGIRIYASCRLFSCARCSRFWPCVCLHFNYLNLLPIFTLAARFVEEKERKRMLSIRE